MTNAAITIRPANLGDLHDLARLARLDSAKPLEGDVLLAESPDGELRAAISAATGAVIADPFEPTAADVELLRVHAAGIRARRRGSRRLPSAAMRVARTR